MTSIRGDFGLHIQKHKSVNSLVIKLELLSHSMFVYRPNLLPGLVKHTLVDSLVEFSLLNKVYKVDMLDIFKLHWAVLFVMD